MITNRLSMLKAAYHKDMDNSLITLLFMRWYD